LDYSDEPQQRRSSVDHVPEFIFAAAALITAVTALIREIKRKQ
jgi:hypothetical protein